MCPLQCNLPTPVAGPAKTQQAKAQAPTVTLTHPGAIQFSAPTALQLTRVPQMVLDRNVSRAALIIQNDSPVPWRAGYGWQPSRGYGTLIKPGQRLPLTGWGVPLEAIWLMADTVSGTSLNRKFQGILIEGTANG